MISIFKSRRCFIVDEKDVTIVLEVMNKHHNRFSNRNLNIGNCGWAEEPTRWFIHFDATSKQYDKILKGLLKVGTFNVVERQPGGQEDLYFERA